MLINDIELLAAKYLEVGGMGRLDDNGRFIRDLARECPEAMTLWDDHVQRLTPEEYRRFQFLVNELRFATN